MSLNLLIETPGGILRTNPVRDLAYCWGELIMMAGRGLPERTRDGRPNQEAWVVEMCRAFGVTEVDLMAAHACLLKFPQLAVEPDLDFPVQVVTESGFNRCPPAAQLSNLAMVGLIFIAAGITAAREVTPKGLPVPEYISMAHAGEMLHRSLFPALMAKGLDLRNLRLQG